MQLQTGEYHLAYVRGREQEDIRKISGDKQTGMLLVHPVHEEQ